MILLPAGRVCQEDPSNKIIICVFNNLQVFKIIDVTFTFLEQEFKVQPMSSQTVQPDGTRHPLQALTGEELELMLQFVLLSGSMKDLARVYQVSYPTIRLRVDRMIERLRQTMAGDSADPVLQLLADLVERGEITVAAARALREVYRQSEKLDS